jgi:hypothetical protein
MRQRGLPRPWLTNVVGPAIRKVQEKKEEERSRKEKERKSESAAKCVVKRRPFFGLLLYAIFCVYL